jgi:hypothetical protein
MTHTPPAAWWDESTETLATVLAIFEEMRREAD